MKTTRRQVRKRSIGLADKSVDELDDDEIDTPDLVAQDVDLDIDVDPKAEICWPSSTRSESWSDDPVRMYLTQMGEIPLLTRQQEVALAKQIELTRAQFRRQVLECDYVMQTAVKVLRRVHEGELPFDRTVQVSVTDQLEKHQILGRLPHNLRTLETLLKRNQRRLQHRHQQVAAGWRSAAPPGAGWAAAAAGPSAWSRNSACGRSGSSR